MIKFNRKMISIVPDDGRRRNVAPQFLAQLKDAIPKPTYLDAGDSESQ